MVVFGSLGTWQPLHNADRSARDLKRTYGASWKRSLNEIRGRRCQQGSDLSKYSAVAGLTSKLLMCLVFEFQKPRFHGDVAENDCRLVYRRSSGYMKLVQ